MAWKEGNLTDNCIERVQIIAFLQFSPDVVNSHPASGVFVYRVPDGKDMKVSVQTNRSGPHN